MPLELHDLLGAVMLLGLAVYAVTGGADFGGGVWDLFARGPRGPAHRRLIEGALAPVWEANHVWLIFVIVVMFSAFPTAFAAVSVALYQPLSLVLLGIVLRGSGFVFRQYGKGSTAAMLRWGRVFAIASVITPFFLGVSLAAVSSGQLRLAPGGQALAPSLAWTTPFAILAGLFVVTLFAFLAAVYLILEGKDEALRDDFRRRALVSGLALGALSIAVRFAAQATTPDFANALLGDWWSNGVQAVVGLCAIMCLVALLGRQYVWARRLAIAQALGIVLGFGIAQHPYLITPDLTLAQAAAPALVLRWLLPAVGAGALVLVPCLVWLMRIFKSPPLG